MQPHARVALLAIAKCVVELLVSYHVYRQLQGALPPVVICALEAQIEILGNMTEDERQYLAGAVSEAHVGLSEVAFKLRRELTPEAPVLKTAIKAERETFRLKRELQRLDIKNLEQAEGRESLPAVNRSEKAVDVEQLPQQKVRHDKP